MTDSAVRLPSYDMLKVRLISFFFDVKKHQQLTCPFSFVQCGACVCFFFERSTTRSGPQSDAREGAMVFLLVPGWVLGGPQV